MYVRWGRLSKLNADVPACGGQGGVWTSPLFSGPRLANWKPEGVGKGAVLPLRGWDYVIIHKREIAFGLRTRGRIHLPESEETTIDGVHTGPCMPQLRGSHCALRPFIASSCKMNSSTVMSDRAWDLQGKCRAIQGRKRGG